MEMQKAYDTKALVDALKQKGIDDAEVVVKDVVDTTCDWLRSSMKLSTEGVLGHLDDLAIPLVDMFQKFADGKLETLMKDFQPARPDPASAPVAPAQPAPGEAPPSS